MLVVSHFSIPFFSYFIAGHYLKSHDNKKSLLIHSSIVGLAGLIPDLTNIHISLAARHNSIAHTLWLPGLTFFFVFIVIFSVKTVRKSLLLWLPFAVLVHLFLDGVSGGVRLFYPSTSIVGKYYIAAPWWGLIDVCFLLLLIVTYRFNEGIREKGAEQYD